MVKLLFKLVRFRNSKSKTTISLFLIFALQSVCLLGQTFSVTGKGSSSKKATSLGNINSELEASAKEHLNLIRKMGDEKTASVARIAMCDYCSPSSELKYKELSGAGLVLISAISHEQSELPLKRAYLSVGGYQIELVKLKSLESKYNSKTNIVAKVYGNYRSDELYILPLVLLNFKPVLKIDFARNREAMALGQMEWLIRSYQPFVVKSKLDEKKLNAYANTEYPDFFKWSKI